MNIQDSIEKGFGSRERAHSMRLNTKFFPIRTNRPHDTPNYGPEKSRFEVDIYRKRSCYPERLDNIHKNWKERVKS